LVDVRSDDYKGGNITDALHLSYAEYRTGKDYVAAIASEAGQKIVFICMYGKEQSPAVAQDFFAASDPNKLLKIRPSWGIPSLVAILCSR